MTPEDASPGLTPASWMRLALAARSLEALGWEWADVPWVVPPDATAATLPPGLRAVEAHWHGRRGVHLVGSAEQSFIDLLLRGRLQATRMCALSPCFRDEREGLSSARRLLFAKVEMFALLSPGDDGEAEVVRAMRDARTAMATAAGTPPLPLDEVRTDAGTDLEMLGTEVGSYGVRAVGLPGGGAARFVYGTGLAEPRFGLVLERLRGGAA